jgi:hypothetical protein
LCKPVQEGSFRQNPELPGPRFAGSTLVALPEISLPHICESLAALGGPLPAELVVAKDNRSGLVTLLRMKRRFALSA